MWLDTEQASYSLCTSPAGIISHECGQNLVKYKILNAIKLKVVSLVT